MTHRKHTLSSATAAIAAALAFTATPLAAQDAAAPAAEAPAVQPIQPVPAVTASPAPVVQIPNVAVPAASGAGDAAQAPEATEPVATPPAMEAPPTTREATTASAASANPTRTTTHTTVTRTTTHAAPPAVAPVAAAPPPESDLAPPEEKSLDTAPVAAPTPAPEPTPAQTDDVVGTLGLVLLGLLALAILAAGLLFFRRRHPVVARTTDAPTIERPVVTPPAPAAVATPLAEPVTLRRRDPNPIAGALPSDGAAIDLPARVPESYEERSALLERMVEARPDRANPFTERKARLRRARLILQSLGTTFDREPRFDLSQYPNNWPELQRPRYKAA